MKTKVKICGIKDQDTLQTVINSGAEFAGFVFFDKSPRHVDLYTALDLAMIAAPHLTPVLLTVDPTDIELCKIKDGWEKRLISHKSVDVDDHEINPLMLQLHGHESPDRVQEIRVKYDIPVVKALRIAGMEDLNLIHDYEDKSDCLLFDAHSNGSGLPGGNGEAFNWELLQDVTLHKPWMLAGGLTPENAAEALAALQPTALDVSSGVESARGVKDAAKIKSFIDAVKSA